MLDCETCGASLSVPASPLGPCATHTHTSVDRMSRRLHAQAPNPLSRAVRNTSQLTLGRSCSWEDGTSRFRSARASPLEPLACDRPMGPTATDGHLSSFVTQLKPRAADRMRAGQDHWTSPTSIASNPADATVSSTHALRSFTLDQHDGPLVRPCPTFATPTGYYGQQFVPVRGAHPTASVPSWNTPYSSDTSMTTTSSSSSSSFLSSSHAPALHPLVLQHSEPIPRSNDDDLAMDAQMLREVLQELPPSQTTHVRHAMPGLQLLFASPLHATDLTMTTSAHPVGGFYTNALGLPSDLVPTMNPPAPVPPLFQSGSSLPLIGQTTGAYDTLLLPSTLPRKKRTTASRICKVDGCTKGIRSRGLCKAHGGGRRCTTPGCTTSDQGGGHCVLHGGGRRCRIDGCQKSAQWRGVCKMHGGARRCRYGQCTKNGQVKQGYCRMHHNLLSAQRQQQEQMQALHHPFHPPPPPAHLVIPAAPPVKLTRDGI